jgi:curli production assembly/transport component CsgE
VVAMKQTAYKAADVVQKNNRKKVEAIFEDTTDLAKDEL